MSQKSEDIRKPVDFTLLGFSVTKLQIPNSFPEGELTNNISVGFAASEEGNNIHLELGQIMVSKENVDDPLEIVSEGIFQIENLNQFKSRDNDSELIFPKNLTLYLLTLLEYWTKGYLMSKLEGTPLETFLPPTLNSSRNLPEEVVIERE